MFDTAAFFATHSDWRAHPWPPLPNPYRMRARSWQRPPRNTKELVARIGALGLIHHGSVVHRHEAAPTDATEKKTGRAPFYQWSSRVNGKTVTRTLSEEEAKLYREWIENESELRQTIKDLCVASERATRAILRENVR
ncbi:DUF6788 family protein [Paeniglutamicibacter gangotriensis]|uniref:DUF6788 family protein n=1 Tax=Paeniglutamicibacter gangotriensis TaxID=254787 RepID=UPI0037C9D56E